MNEKTKLGFVTMSAGEVNQLASEKLAAIMATREKKRIEWIEEVKQKPTKCRFWPRKALTDDEAIATIEDNMFDAQNYFFLTPEWESPVSTALKNLITASEHLLGGGNTEMMLTIEAVNMLL
jgi:hypothetical protein